MRVVPEQVETVTHRPSTVILAAHARRGLIAERISGQFRPILGADLGGGGDVGGCNPPKPWRLTVNSAQEFKFIVQYARRVQCNLSTKREQAYQVRGAVEPQSVERKKLIAGKPVNSCFAA